MINLIENPRPLTPEQVRAIIGLAVVVLPAVGAQIAIMIREKKNNDKLNKTKHSATKTKRR